LIANFNISQGDSVDDGCPGFSGLAAQSTSYVYPNSADCPNPAPPQ
jgi:hypothetical protein